MMDIKEVLLLCVLDKTDLKPNKIWEDKCREFYNNSFKKWLKDYDTEMYSTHNEGKSVLLKDLLEL